MKYLIDTHVLIWIFSATDRLSNRAIELLDSTDNDIMISPLSFWEISIKESIGKLSIKNCELQKLPEIAQKNGFEFLNITADDYATYSQLPLNENHKDPFDRMLIHLAIKRKIPLISCDSKFKDYEKYGLQLVW